MTTNAVELCCAFFVRTFVGPALRVALLVFTTVTSAAVADPVPPSDDNTECGNAPRDHFGELFNPLPYAAAHTILAAAFLDVCGNDPDEYTLYWRSYMLHQGCKPDSDIARSLEKFDYWQYAKKIDDRVWETIGSNPKNCEIIRSACQRPDTYDDHAAKQYRNCAKSKEIEALIKGNTFQAVE